MHRTERVFLRIELRIPATMNNTSHLRKLYCAGYGFLVIVPPPLVEYLHDCARLRRSWFVV